VYSEAVLTTGGSSTLIIAIRPFPWPLVDPEEKVITALLLGLARVDPAGHGDVLGQLLSGTLLLGR
jgi:hypothetical protein